MKTEEYPRRRWRVLLPAAFFALAWLAGGGAPPVLGEPITAVSLLASQLTGTGRSENIRWDRNGRFAIFTSEVQDLLPGQNTGGRAAVFLYDRISGKLKLVSHVPGNASTGGNTGISGSSSPQISGDGRWVAYTSNSTDLVSGQVDGNNSSDVFLWNRESDTTVLVSHQAGAATTSGNLGSTTSRSGGILSDDGRFLAYSSQATNLIANHQANAFSQVWLFDRTAGNSVLVSHAFNSLSRSANQGAAFASGKGRVMSADGRWVVFTSLATDHVNGVTDINGDRDVYLWDRQASLADSLRLLSRRAGFPLTAANNRSDQPMLSSDGKGVVFTSEATNLEGIGSDANNASDVFHYDREADVLSLVSHATQSATTTGNGPAFFPSIGGPGGRVAFESGATNHVLLQSDDNGTFDVFLWQGAAVSLISHLPGSTRQTGDSVSVEPLVADDGSVAFSSSSSDLVDGVVDTNDSFDVFLRPRTTTQISLISHLPDETGTADEFSVVDSIVLGGALIGFESIASNLITGDVNNALDVFFHGSLLMADGFESGDFAAWSQHLP